VRRVNVVGVTGSGKTTFARKLAARLGYPHIELDALYHEPNWQAAPLHIFRERTHRALSADCWVVDGNYSKVRDIVWIQADTIVWLNYPFPLVLWRLFRRTIRRVIMKQEMWESRNRETWRRTLSRDSILVWAFQSYNRRKREYPRLFTEWPHLDIVILRSPDEAERWLQAQNSRGDTS
jgi:adenylate kinase family enzyme